MYPVRSSSWDMSSICIWQVQRISFASQRDVSKLAQWPQAAPNGHIVAARIHPSMAIANNFENINVQRMILQW